MPLDPQVQAHLEQMAALNIPEFSTLTPELIRQVIKTQVVVPASPEPLARIENRTLPGPLGEIAVRIYTPRGSGPFPLLVYFHGGGWVICNLDTHDGTCRSLAHKAGCVVVSIDYHLAPEYKFPAAVQDCYAATLWTAENAVSLQGDATRLAIGGDSAGGNIAAAVALMLRDNGGPALRLQLLIYPATDLQIRETPSLRENATGYGLTKNDIFWYRDHYLNNPEERLNPLASPFLAADLHGLPPALILTAEYDPLRDDGEAYGQRLREADVPVTVHRYDGMIHGFVGMDTLFEQGKQGLQECATALQREFQVSE